MVREYTSMKASVAARALMIAVPVAAVACGATPPPYAPLPIVDVAPQVLDDLEETRRYLNAFPLDDYQRYDVPEVGSFFIDDPADMIKQVIVAGDKWERHSFDLLAEHIVPGSVVIEVGAHIGTHTVRMGQLAGPWGRVYAFEPQRKIYRELHHNLALNGVTNVVALRMAVGSGETRIIEMNPATPGNEGGTGVGAGGDAAELRSLDSFGFERVSLLKIDVETYENEVLDGALDTIRRNRPVMLIEIMGGHDPETASPDVLERIAVTREKIEALGYSVTQVFKHDYIAVPVD
jgi:FkbM family methyltransferase